MKIVLYVKDKVYNENKDEIDKKVIEFYKSLFSMADYLPVRFLDPTNQLILRLEPVGDMTLKEVK